MSARGRVSALCICGHADHKRAVAGSTTLRCNTCRCDEYERDDEAAPAKPPACAVTHSQLQTDPSAVMSAALAGSVVTVTDDEGRPRMQFVVPQGVKAEPACSVCALRDGMGAPANVSVMTYMTGEAKPPPTAPTPAEMPCARCGIAIPYRADEVDPTCNAMDCCRTCDEAVLKGCWESERAQVATLTARYDEDFENWEQVNIGVRAHAARWKALAKEFRRSFDDLATTPGLVMSGFDTIRRLNDALDVSHKTNERYSTQVATLTASLTESTHLLAQARHARDAAAKHAEGALADAARFMVERDALRARLERATGLLRSAEWRLDDEGFMHCGHCFGGDFIGHSRGCELAAFLAGDWAKPCEHPSPESVYPGHVQWCPRCGAVRGTLPATKTAFSSWGAWRMAKGDGAKGEGREK